jgi:hypothetical protein
MIPEEKIIEQIKEFFEDNYEMLRIEGGHMITEDAKKQALNQVIYYYKRLKDVAERVTETEVKLALPDQKTTKGRNFTIEGVVDIVREEKETWMYDIKTHELLYVISNKEFYEKQLNVYAHIWQQLRGEELDHTAVISTSIPKSLNEAIRSEEPQRIDFELKRWEPLVNIPFSQQKIKETINEFGDVVDEIEDKNFKPAPTDKLNENISGTKTDFATRVCRNCDARFSCLSFREFSMGAGRSSKFTMKEYFDDFGTDGDREDWVNTNLQATDFEKFEG